SCRPHRHNRQGSSHAVAREREEQVGVPESERSQSLELDDGAVLRVACAMSERLRGAGPIIVLAPFGRVRNPVDVAGHCLLDERQLLQWWKIARRRNQALHGRRRRRVLARSLQAVGKSIRPDRYGARSEKVRTGYEARAGRSLTVRLSKSRLR